MRAVGGDREADAYWINLRLDGKVRVGGFFGGCSSGAWKYLDSTTSVPVNTWTHVASTCDGSTLTVSINDQRAGSRAVTGRTCSNIHPPAIGAKNYPAKGLLEAFWAAVSTTCGSTAGRCPHPRSRASSRLTNAVGRDPHP